MSLRFVFVVNSEKIVTDVTADDNRWHHIAVTWTSDTGHWKMYRDGILKDEGHLAKGQVIECKREFIQRSYFKGYQ